MENQQKGTKSVSDDDITTYYSRTSLRICGEEYNIETFLDWEDHNVPEPSSKDIDSKQWFPEEFLACHINFHSLPSMDESDDTSTWGIRELDVLQCFSSRMGYYKLLVSIRGTDRKYVIELTPKINCENEEAKDELLTLYRIYCLVRDNPFFVRLMLSFETARSFCFVLEYLHMGDLAEYLAPRIHLSECQSKIFIAEIALALHFLHNNGIIYRNMSLSNILVAADDLVKLSSFRNCIYAKTASGRRGSITYMSPEMHKEMSYDFTSDLWSLGMIGFKLLAGTIRRGSRDSEEIIMKEASTSRRGSFPVLRSFKREFLEFPSFVSNDARKFIEELMQNEPKYRLGSGVLGFREIKGHPFFRGLNWKDLEKI